MKLTKSRKIENILKDFDRLYVGVDDCLSSKEYQMFELAGDVVKWLSKSSHAKGTNELFWNFDSTGVHDIFIWLKPESVIVNKMKAFIKKTEADIVDDQSEV